MKRRIPRKFNTRGLISLLVGLLFLVMLASGVVLYIAPKGRVANWTNWTLCVLDKEQWSAVHINSSLLLVIASVLHVWFNWKPLWHYVSEKVASGPKFTLEFPVALIVVVLWMVGTLCDVPPFSSVMRLNDQAQAYWASKASRAPVPHSEALSIEEFAMHVHLSSEDAAEALRKEGFVVDDPRTTLAELAKQKEVAPSHVYKAIQKHFPEAGVMPSNRQGLGGGSGQGKGRGSGVGKGK